MRTPVSKRRTWLFVFAAASVLAMQAWGAAKRDPLVGDWRIESAYDGRQMVSVVSLSRGKDGELAGQWISLWGVTELGNIRFEGNKLSFTRTRRFRDRESTSNFAGTVEKAKLAGIVSSERGESRVTGQRIRGIRKPVGEWEATVRVNGQEYAARLAVQAQKKGRLAASWESDWGEHEITDVAFKKGKLAFKRRSKVQDRQWDSAFEGTITGHALSGTFTGGGESVPLEGKRVGAALVGTWDLKITSDSGSRSQRLKVYPDLTGMYGPLGVDRVRLEANRVSFETVAEFGDQKFDVRFTGTLDGGTLRGEVASARGSRSVEGVKRTRKPARKPDVVFVPTPEEAVEKMLELAQVKKDDLLYDLGCGDGRIVVTAAKTYGCRAVGYDISPKRVRESRENVEQNDVGDLVSIEQRDIFTLDLSDANVVTLYLLPSLNVKLIPQLEKLKPGSRIVSHDFDMQGVTPDEVVTVTTDDS
ncbi:MAG: SAM-dependent methyltransferase, partial [Planctomycetota bacterium]